MGAVIWSVAPALIARTILGFHPATASGRGAASAPGVVGAIGQRARISAAHVAVAHVAVTSIATYITVTHVTVTHVARSL